MYTIAGRNMGKSNMFMAGILYQTDFTKTTNPNQPKQKLKDLKKKPKTDDERNQQSEAISDSDTENRSPLKSRKDNNKKKKRSNFTMIVKPDCMSQGKGIFMTHDLDSIPLIEPCVV